MSQADKLFSNAESFANHLHTLRRQRLEAKNTNIPQTKRSPGLSPKQRGHVLEKTRRHCHICGGHIEGKWVVDHVFSRTLGGEHNSENLLPAHVICNRCKWFYGSEEFQWILKLGVWFRTQIEEKRNPAALALTEEFLAYERRARRRRKTG